MAPRTRLRLKCRAPCQACERADRTSNPSHPRRPRRSRSGPPGGSSCRPGARRRPLIASRSGMAQRCSINATAAVVPIGIVSAIDHMVSSPSRPSSAASAPRSAPASTPSSSPSAPRPINAPAMAPNSARWSSDRSLSSTPKISPSSSFETTTMSTRRTMSSSLRRWNSGMISPLKVVPSNPTTRTCTGPNSSIGCLSLRSGRSGVEDLGLLRANSSSVSTPWSWSWPSCFSSSIEDCDMPPAGAAGAAGPPAAGRNQRSRRPAGPPAPPGSPVLARVVDRGTAGGHRGPPEQWTSPTPHGRSPPSTRMVWDGRIRMQRPRRGAPSGSRRWSRRTARS